jgi:hypothetical protein
LFPIAVHNVHLLISQIDRFQTWLYHSCSALQNSFIFSVDGTPKAW